MKILPRLLVAGLLAGALASLRAADAPNPLVWDALEKRAAAKAGDAVAEFAFDVKNTGAVEVEVQSVEPSCGCTTAELPAKPWRLAPGASGTLRLKIDLVGKQGEIAKTAMIYSTAGAQTLTMRLNIAPMAAAERARNQQLTLQHRQAIFQGECAHCHAAPAVGKQGGELFEAVCGICHAARNRASAVPDLAQSTVRRDAAYWHGLIAEGRAGTMMPAFAQSRGGPLTDVQLVSLVDFMLQAFPEKPVANLPP